MTPTQIKKARMSAGLTQTAAAELIGKTTRTWQRYESGAEPMNASLIELFLLKISGQKLS